MTTIGVQAFTCYGGNIEYIVIPESVKTIKEQAFFNTTFPLYCEAESESNGWIGVGRVYWYSEAEPTAEGNYWHYVDGVPTKW